MEAANTHPINEILPPEILSLPKVEVPVAGVVGYSLQNDEKQVVFFVFDEGVSFPDHSHCEQRGMVVSGEMVLEIDGETNLYQDGDFYLVPEGVRHRANFSRRTVLVDMSDAPNRYDTHDLIRATDYSGRGPSSTSNRLSGSSRRAATAMTWSGVHRRICSTSSANALAGRP